MRLFYCSIRMGGYTASGAENADAGHIAERVFRNEKLYNKINIKGRVVGSAFLFRAYRIVSSFPWPYSHPFAGPVH